MIINNKEPLVSIVMNCYNGEKYLNQAIQSIRSQKYQNWEIIFWDNQSKDDSKKIFKSYKDERFIYYYADQHTFLSEARSKAILKCKGELIAFLDVDDWWLPEKLEKQVPLFIDESVGLSCCNFFIANQRNLNNDIIKPQYSYVPSGYVINEIIDDNFVHMSTLMIRKKILFKEEYIFDSRLNIIQDLDLVTRLCSKWRMASIQQPVAFYRWHKNNTGNNVKILAKELKKFLNKIQKYNSCKYFINHKNIKKFEYKVKLYQVLSLLICGKKRRALRFHSFLKFKHRIKLYIALFLPTKYLKSWIQKT